MRCDRPTLPLRGQRGGMLQRARIPKPCILGSLEHIDFFYRDASDSYIAQGPWYGTGDLGPLGHIDLVYVIFTDSYDAHAPLPTIPLSTELRCRSSRPGLAFPVVQDRICLAGRPARDCLTGRPGQVSLYRGSRQDLHCQLSWPGFALPVVQNVSPYRSSGPGLGCLRLLHRTGGHGMELVTWDLWDTLTSSTLTFLTSTSLYKHYRLSPLVTRPRCCPGQDQAGRLRFGAHRPSL